MSTAIPLPDAGSFRSAERRTRLLRTGLAIALVGTLVAAFLLSRGARAQTGAPARGASTVVVLDLSWSTSSDYGEIARTLRRLASSDGRIGLVVFSDVAYEMFPAGTPAIELRPLLRFFNRPKGRRVESPWASSLSAGTRLSAGLLLGQELLRRDRVSNGSVVLVSDLSDAPDDRAQLTGALLSYQREGIPLRVVAIDPTAGNERFFKGLLGSRPLRPRTGGGSALVASSSSNGLRLALAVAAAVLLVLLAVNELACARLTWREEPKIVTRGRLLLALAAVLCLCAAAAAALLASDVHGWQSAVRAADGAVVADPARSVPSRTGDVFPFHVARSLLGLDDDIALRRAFVLFRGGYSGIPSRDQSTAGTEARAQAEVALGRVIGAEGDGRRAATAANLLGVLAFVDSLSGAGQAPAPVERSIVEFQNAIRLDPSNGDAKANLELALSVLHPDSPFQSSRNAATGKRRGGASLTTPGRGY